MVDRGGLDLMWMTKTETYNISQDWMGLQYADQLCDWLKSKGIAYKRKESTIAITITAHMGTYEFTERKDYEKP